MNGEDTQCYSGLWRLPNIRAVLSLGDISLPHREMKLLLRVLHVKPIAITGKAKESFCPTFRY